MSFFIGPFRSFDRRSVHQEVEEELQFHLDLLSEELCGSDMSRDEAQATAIARFGNFAQIRNECVRIVRRNDPLIAALKWFLTFVFVGGVLVRVFSNEYHLTRVGDILMEIGALGRLLLYLRGMSRSRRLSRPEDSSRIKLSDSEMFLAAYERSQQTPVERVISHR